MGNTRVANRHKPTGLERDYQSLEDKALDCSFQMLFSISNSLLFKAQMEIESKFSHQLCSLRSVKSKIKCLTDKRKSEKVDGAGSKRNYIRISYAAKKRK